MTGPEHYKAAEEHLGILLIEKDPDGWRDALQSGELAVALQAAQVHATLAGVYAHNRATTELTGLLHAMLDQIRELRESGVTP